MVKSYAGLLLMGKENLEKLFMSHVLKTDSCWAWTGLRSGEDKRARLEYKHRSYVASRVAWFLKFGRFPPQNLFVCHHCDNPGCVNTEHLFLGTQKDNIRDAMAKGRYNREAQKRGSAISRKKRLSIKRCKRGHLYSKDNLIPKPEGRGECRECHKMRMILRRFNLVAV